MGFDQGEGLVVGVSVAGVTAARRAGMRVLGFIGGGHAYDGLTERLGEAGAFAVVSSLSDVLDHAR